MDRQQQQAFKLQLLGQRTDLLAQLAQLRGGEIGRAQASADHFSEPEDNRAQRSAERALEFALDEHESAALNQIDAALARMEAGVYGECVDCGKGIGLARLQAAPQALRCIGCQEVFERSDAGIRK
jgi:DnaK suppressor protein